MRKARQHHDAGRNARQPCSLAVDGTGLHRLAGQRAAIEEMKPKTPEPGESPESRRSAAGGVAPAHPADAGPKRGRRCRNPFPSRACHATQENGSPDRDDHQYDRDGVARRCAPQRSEDRAQRRKPPQRSSSKGHRQRKVQATPESHHSQSAQHDEFPVGKVDQVGRR